MDEEGVLDFLTSLEAMDLPDRIEEVNSKILQKIIEDTDFVAVLFCKSDWLDLNTYFFKRLPLRTLLLSEIWIDDVLFQSSCSF